VNDLRFREREHRRALGYVLERGFRTDILEAEVRAMLQRRTADGWYSGGRDTKVAKR